MYKKKSNYTQMNKSFREKMYKKKIHILYLHSSLLIYWYESMWIRCTRRYTFFV